MNNRKAFWIGLILLTSIARFLNAQAYDQVEYGRPVFKSDLDGYFKGPIKLVEATGISRCENSKAIETFSIYNFDKNNNIDKVSFFDPEGDVDYEYYDNLRIKAIRYPAFPKTSPYELFWTYNKDGFIEKKYQVNDGDTSILESHTYPSNNIQVIQKFHKTEINNIDTLLFEKGKLIAIKKYSREQKLMSYQEFYYVDNAIDSIYAKSTTGGMEVYQFNKLEYDEEDRLINSSMIIQAGHLGESTVVYDYEYEKLEKGEYQILIKQTVNDKVVDETVKVYDSHDNLIYLETKKDGCTYIDRNRIEYN